MDYELAKELKDAGWKDIILYDETNSAITPTLEELIEACGEQFERLEYTPEVSMNPWWAHERVRGVHNTGDGKTPTEAVTRLWLALHHDK